MKINFNATNRVRLMLGVATMALLPLGSSFNAAEAKPPKHAPAWGYRRKNDDRNRWDRNRWDRDRDRRNDWRRDRYDRNRRDDWRRNSWDRDRDRYSYRPTRSYTTRWRTITTRDGRRVRQYYRVYR